MNRLNLCAVAVILCAGSLAAKADTIINLNATANPSYGSAVPNNLASSFFYTATLGPGTYSVSAVGVGTPGAVYSGWNPADNPSTNGRWRDDVAINGINGSPNNSASFSNNPNTYAYPNGDTSIFPGYSFGSGAAAVAAAQAAGPYFFTLNSTTQVTFYIPDLPNTTFYPGFQDNTGGVSLNLKAVTPEPSSLMLLGTGALSLAGMVRRRLRS